MVYKELKNIFKKTEDRILDGYTKAPVMRIVDKYELEVWGSPIYKQELAVVQEFLDTEFGEKCFLRSLKSYTIRQFLKICEDNMDDAVIGVYRQLILNGAEKLRTRMVKSPLHLKLFLDEVYPEKGLRATEASVIYRAFCWLTYMGILDDDMDSLTRDNVDLENMTVYSNGLGYQIYTEAYPSIKACATEDNFEYIHSKYRSVMSRYQEGTVNKPLLMGIKGGGQIESLKVEFRRSNTKAVNAKRVIQGLSYQDIRSSGLYYNAYIAELTTDIRKIDFRDPVRLEFADKLKNDSEDVRKYKISRTQKRYLDEYILWKFAFNLLDD